MDYTTANKAAWEEVFKKHQAGYGEDLVKRLIRGEPLLDKDLLAALADVDVSGKAVAQFSCNNGRELLSVVRMGASHGTGFDIAENFIAEGQRLAREAGLAADFVATDILAVGHAYADRFDLLIITCGTLTWFADLEPFFEKVALVLRKGGRLLISEKHPFTDMVALPHEAAFDESCPERAAYSYFRKEPWVETDGVDYVGNTMYESKPLTSFAHTFGAIISAMARSGLVVDSVDEYDHDICAEWSHLDGKGIPLSYLMQATLRS